MNWGINKRVLRWVCFMAPVFAQPEGARTLRVFRAERTDLSNAGVKVLQEDLTSGKEWL